MHAGIKMHLGAVILNLPISKSSICVPDISCIVEFKQSKVNYDTELK